MLVDYYLIMTNQELIQQLNNLREIKPSTGWVRQTKKDLKSQMPSSHWKAYSGAFVIALILALSAISYESPNNQNLVQNSETQEINFSKFTQEQAVETVKQAKKVSQKIEQNIQEQIQEVQEVQATKTESSQEDEIDPLVKLYEDLEKAQLRTEILEQIEELVKNNDFVMAREMLDKLIINGQNIDNPSNSD